MATVEAVVGAQRAASWQYLIRGYWESGFRLSELLDMHWTDGAHIMPMWSVGELPVLAIPFNRQKNQTEEAITLLPGLESLLLETRETDRTGWIFEPQ